MVAVVPADGGFRRAPRTTQAGGYEFGPQRHRGKKQRRFSDRTPVQAQAATPPILPPRPDLGWQRLLINPTEAPRYPHFSAMA